MDIISLVFAALIIFLTLAWLTRKKSDKKSLPGPTGLPFVGYLPFLTKKPYIKLQELAKKYGPVYKIRLGSVDILVLCDFNIIKEAFAEDAFMGRPADGPFELSDETIRTGAFLGLGWKEQRRFSLHALRDLGFGKTRMEAQLKEEIVEMLERIEEQRSEPIKISDILASSVSNNIASLLYGSRMKYDDPRRKNLDKLIGNVGLLAGAVGWQMFFPWARAIMTYLQIGDNGKLSRALEGIKEFSRKEMEEHEKTLDPNNIRDFMDRYIIEIQKREGQNTGFHREVLLDLARGFFGAGSTTIRVSVDWMCLVMAGFPEVQKKIQMEIDDVIGRDRFPTYKDHLQMPYTEAAICELMRWKTIIPLNLMRSTLEDTELKGYFIPKDSHVLAVLYVPDHDETLWGKDVHDYKPERFLSKDGKKLIKPEYFIPFSTGKRSCPGKPLAEVELFLYFTAILQKYKISMPPGKKPDFDGILGIGLEPKKQGLKIEPR
uniref:Cytochrome P450 18a1 n=1 Tax=Parasteatoda tepidariorum TaxID=114398 RepID=A0A2L2Y1J5_PARTP